VYRASKAKATDRYADYPLPPNEEKTEILRVVVRESMSLDLLDRLISDIIAVTQTLMESDIGDLSALQPTATSTEKQYQSQGVDAKHRKKHGSKTPMSEGIHRTVC
jgi:glutamate decarboxylase